MAKLFKLTEENETIVQKVFEDTGLYNYIDLKILGTTKSNDLISIKKTGPIAEELGNCPNSIVCIVYEDAFDRLNDETKLILLENAFSNVSFDVEKEKIKIGSPRIVVTLGSLNKYKEKIVNAAESGVMAILQIEEEKKDNGQ